MRPRWRGSGEGDIAAELAGRAVDGDVAGVGVPGGPAGSVDEFGPDALGGRVDDDGVVREQVGGVRRCHDFLSFVPGITYFSFSLVSPGQLAPKGEHASLLMLRNTAANIVRQMSSATANGCLRYGIHARFGAYWCASARVD